MYRKRRIIQITYIAIFCMILLLSGCASRKTGKDDAANQKQEMEQWLKTANLNDNLTKEQLYEAALSEDTLVIYSVSSRAFEVKESFEKEYPGLTVEIKDVRSNDVVDMVHANYENGEYDCDLIICSDCDGSLYKELLEPGIIYTYIPWDIEPYMKDGHADEELDFLGESVQFFYNSNVYDRQPIENIWELSEEKYQGKIIMANPLSSFSTYGFCSAMFTEADAIEQAYSDYFGKKLDIPEEKSAGEVFWEKIIGNIVFTNSSDEVLEGIGNQGDDYWIGIMISSKMRYQELGYHFEPIYNLNPIAAVYTPNSISIAGGCKNVNAAKLFIRYLLGESDGTGDGYQPFSTAGTWSSRTDVPDGNDVPLSEIVSVVLDKEYLYKNRDSMNLFWERLLRENVN